eukprot:495371-Pyramimonas_sp.AAC.1
MRVDDDVAAADAADDDEDGEEADGAADDDDTDEDAGEDDGPYLKSNSPLVRLVAKSVHSCSYRALLLQARTQQVFREPPTP